MSVLWMSFFPLNSGGAISKSPDASGNTLLRHTRHRFPLDWNPHRLPRLDDLPLRIRTVVCVHKAALSDHLNHSLRLRPLHVQHLHLPVTAAPFQYCVRRVGQHCRNGLASQLCELPVAVVVTVHRSARNVLLINNFVCDHRHHNGRGVQANRAVSLRSEVDG